PCQCHPHSLAIGLRLGVTLCIPHLCHYCGSNVDTLGTHGLSCRFSADHHFRHTMLNYILHKALPSANVPSRLEPTGLDRTDAHPLKYVQQQTRQSRTRSRKLGRHIVNTTRDKSPPAYLLISAKFFCC
ncbi:hypothetical protein EMCRGX_G026172, partial [Ephydatia muelleri]